MIKPLLIAVLGAALFGPTIVGCAPSVNITAEKSEGADLSKYSTFGWRKSTSTLRIQGHDLNPKVPQWIGESISKELENRGYTKSDSPQLLLKGLVRVDNRTEPWLSVDTTSARMAPGFHTETITYDLGTLVIEVYDASTNKRVWRGVAEAQVRPGAGQGRISSAISQMFKDFPESAAQ